MAVTKVSESWKGVDLQTKASLDGATGSLTAIYHVEFDASDALASRPVLALDASHGGVTVPDYYAAHPADSNFYVMQKSVKPIGPTLWEVTVVYEFIENPLLQPYSVQFIPQASMEAIDKAIQVADGVESFSLDLVNSSKEPFDPPIQEEFYDFSILIRRNEAAFDITTANGFLNTVNNDTFAFVARNGVTYQFAAGQARCKSIQAEERRHGATWFFEVAYEFVVRRDGWQRRILDQGFRKLENNTYITIADAEGNPLTQPVKLNGAGLPLSPDDEAVFLEFQTKKTAAFAGFNF